MAGLIGEVTRQLQLQMEQEFSRMSATLKDTDKKGGMPVEEISPSLLAPGEKKDWWYAVVFAVGRGGLEYVTGVPGAAVKKYDSFEKAYNVI
jgi:hypothetical protein